MSEITLECQGLPCPQPVLESKRCIEESNPSVIKIIVDNEPAKENVSRFIATKGYKASAEKRGNEFIVTGVQDTSQCEECSVMNEEHIQAVSQRAGKQQICVFIDSSTIGSGDDELGSKLMLNFLATLPELGEELWRIVLVNGGVKLAVTGNPCLEKLETLEKSGVSILVCGTCLEFFDILKDKRVGDTTNMLDVVTSLQTADKVIKA